MVNLDLLLQDEFFVQISISEILNVNLEIRCSKKKVRIRYEWVQSIKMKVRDGYSDWTSDYFHMLIYQFQQS